MISLLLPTRKRINLLTDCINSIVNNCESKDNFEILFAIDPDDNEMIEYIKKFDQCNFQYLIMEIRYGYGKLNEYVNRLCQIAKGDLLWLFNDDAEILTKDWDRIILNNTMSNKIELYNFNNNNHRPNIFPMITKKMYNILGYFSKHPCIDSYVLIMSRTINSMFEINIMKYISDVQLVHKIILKNTNRLIYKERDEHIMTVKKSFWTDENQKNILDDAKKLGSACVL